jgi:CDP-diacylglycerol--serine O-phosphatidyltransferase
MKLSERLIDPNSPERAPRRAAYALPTLFTAGNLFLGYVAVMKALEGAMKFATGDPTGAAEFTLAAQAIGIAVFLDGLDGRIARMTNTTSEFGKEIDSLADCVSFGIAPAVLAFAWGVQFLDLSLEAALRDHILRAGYFLCFVFLLCGAARLARFNVTKNPVPKNPGRPDRKYFVGLPIPAAAGMVAAVVYAEGSVPLTSWMATSAWLGLMGLLSFLMVSTWRYHSFKELNLLRPRSPLSVVLFGAFIYLIWNYSQAMLLALAVTYVGSGIVIRIGGIIRRMVRGQHGKPEAEHQVG